ARKPPKHTGASEKKPLMSALLKALCVQHSSLIVNIKFSTHNITSMPTDTSLDCAIPWASKTSGNAMPTGLALPVVQIREKSDFSSFGVVLGAVAGNTGWLQGIPKRNKGTVMKFGMRKPSMRRSFKARTTGRAKRSMKRATNPLYGKKGMGLAKNPKRALKNAAYRRTTFSLRDIFK